MGRKPCSFKEDLNKGAWTAEEDKLLTNYIHTHGETGWRSLPKKAGLNRCGKSCRLRWLNYLRPDIKRGNISADEDELIIRMHRLLGNRWALIAGRLPGRTDNEIKNYWNTHLSKKIAMSNSTSTTHLPIQKWSSFSGIKKQSPCSQNSSADEGAEPCEMRCASDNDVSSGILEGMQASMEAALDVSKSWTQLLEDALMADDESNIILSSSRLNVSYSVDCNPFSLHCIDFGRIENFSIESLIQPGPYDILEDMCPTPLQNTHNNTDCVAMADDEGIADALQQRQHCADEASHMELDPLDELFYYDQEEQVDFTGLAKISDEEYVDILVDNPK